jgi:hypothetical protein
MNLFRRCSTGCSYAGPDARYEARGGRRLQISRQDIGVIDDVQRPMTAELRQGATVLQIAADPGDSRGDGVTDKR